MSIRPMDLQVLIPRSLDAAKIASSHDQQPAAQQQVAALRLKQEASEQQHQVQTALSSQHDGKVDTEDLDEERKRKRRNRGGADEHGERDGGAAPTGAEKLMASSGPPDPVRGQRIDIKT